MSPLILLVVACAALTFGAQIVYVPPYVDFTESTDRAIQEVRRHLIIDANGDITDPNRHYLVIVNTLKSVVDSLLNSENGTYDDIYLPTVNRAVSEALENPLKVVNDMEVLLARIEDVTRPLKTLIKTTCSVNDNANSCDQVIDDEVKGDPERYKQASEVLQAAGRLAWAFNNSQASEFSDAAARYGELPYLINSQDHLEDFVNKAVAVVALI